MTKRLSLLGTKLKGWAPNFIQVAAMVAFCAGFFLIGIPVGLIVTGIVLGVVGWAVDSE